jgi:hypothetical protein
LISICGEDNFPVGQKKAHGKIHLCREPGKIACCRRSQKTHSKIFFCLQPRSANFFCREPLCCEPDKKLTAKHWDHINLAIYGSGMHVIRSKYLDSWSCLVPIYYYVDRMTSTWKRKKAHGEV